MVCLALVMGLLLVCHWGLGDLDAGIASLLSGSGVTNPTASSQFGVVAGQAVRCRWFL